MSEPEKTTANALAPLNPDDYRNPAWERTDLGRWGWEPGDYVGGKCRTCGLRLPMHRKRARQCAPCAADAEWRAAEIEARLDAEYGRMLT